MDVRRSTMVGLSARHCDGRECPRSRGMPPGGVRSMTAPDAAGDVRQVPQPVSAPLTRAAIFLIVTINPGADNRATVRSFCGDLAALLRAVEVRAIESGLSCVMGIGSDAWDRFFRGPR